MVRGRLQWGALKVRLCSVKMVVGGVGKCLGSRWFWCGNLTMAMSPSSFLYVKCLVASARNLGCVVSTGLFPWMVVTCALVVGVF